jgi:hypothetical protein
LTETVPRSGKAVACSTATCAARRQGKKRASDKAFITAGIRGGEEAKKGVLLRPRIVESAATFRARWVPRSVSRKRVTGAPPPEGSGCGGGGGGEEADIAGLRRPPVERGGEKDGAAYFENAFWV